MTGGDKRLFVVGGGAAGMMAAITAARLGCPVTLAERNPKLGRKLYITGKGRCNVTNHCSPEEVLSATPRNGKFLYSAVNHTPPAEVERFFEELGVPLKVERGNRVFPQSDKAADIIDALFYELKRLKVPVLQTRVTGLEIQEDRVVGLETEQGQLEAGAVILATGGLSYPATGSTGDGHQMAARAGHTVVEPKPSLVPLESPEAFCGEMQGLALKNVMLTVKNQKGKTLYREQGEMLFTHFGLSGPLVLSASAHMRNFDREQYTCILDLKPALDEQALDARLVRELSQGANRDMNNLMGALLPRLMIPVVLRLSGIPGEKKAHDITREERRRLLELLKAFPVPVSMPRPIAEAIVTSGGVKVGEVDPKTMASKKVRGLYFAGELLDVDAYTGGFNLQIAWCTGRAAGEYACSFLREA
ncbi:NAD(P)/FAD-dependent oxidoreductase [Lawsonibacter sp. LCP25S3_G6]|uniref:NAD(P)/FAD-dependent oxidoreductase n=1 Tax=unclassified Lawsonibacter TaxID=2617946 RepID=UPI003F9512E6